MNRGLWTLDALRPTVRTAGQGGAMTESWTRAELGALGEQLAVDHLTALGLRVIDRNWRCRYGELRCRLCRETPANYVVKPDTVSPTN